MASVMSIKPKFERKSPVKSYKRIILICSEPPSEGGLDLVTSRQGAIYILFKRAQSPAKYNYFLTKLPKKKSTLSFHFL